MPLVTKILVAALGLIAVAAALALILGAAKSDDAPTARHHPGNLRERAKSRKLEAQRDRMAREARAAAAVHAQASRVQAASAGTNGSEGQASGARSAGASDARLAASFVKLQSEIGGEIGVAYAPLGSPVIAELGGVAVLHAWSSFKVPIVAALAAAQHGSLSDSQESEAQAAITASDNAAAASLFADLESATGGAASAALEALLDGIPGGATVVATAPPPPGAYSSWGQSEWSLAAATAFYGALACGSYGVEAPSALADMEAVIPEQQWGLGTADFGGAAVAFKAGWGPDGSEAGPYLVRQSGVVRAPGGGLVVTIAAQDESGSFEAGVDDLDRLAAWVAREVPPTGTCN